MDAGMWLVSAFFKKEYWNFQDKLLLWFREASQNLSLFRQLFFMVSNGGPKEKCWKKQCIILAIFQHFFLKKCVENGHIKLETTRKIRGKKSHQLSSVHLMARSWKFSWNLLFWICRKGRRHYTMKFFWREQLRFPRCKKKSKVKI